VCRPPEISTAPALLDHRALRARILLSPVPLGGLLFLFSAPTKRKEGKKDRKRKKKEDGRKGR